ncbi:hypothetical protein Godav_029702 [Gossypium davidsonii]|uniref:Uncharacterized protein n=1 Tax=Gossypium davidsonii TaxID=34287 RepID=A0A7J8TIM6_GOSDV|nr:hypothetical protein [Gossypium davidsonii]
MGSVARADSSVTCEQLLGNVSNKFRGSWIEMGWLEDNFKTIEASEEMYDRQLGPRRGQPRRKEMNMEIIIKVHVKLKEKDNNEPLDQIVSPQK